MQTDCISDLFGFAPVKGRPVVAAFDGGKHHLGRRRAAAWRDRPGDRSHRWGRRLLPRRASARADRARGQTLIGQRVFGLALGYEDLIDHDELRQAQLRQDPVMAILAGKLEARREDCAPVAGKSTLNRLELSRPLPTRYHKISHDVAMIESLLACWWRRIACCARGLDGLVRS